MVDTVAMEGIDFGNTTDSGTSVFEGKPGKGVLTRLVISGQSGKVSWLAYESVYDLGFGCAS